MEFSGWCQNIIVLNSSNITKSNELSKENIIEEKKSN